MSFFVLDFDFLQSIKDIGDEINRFIANNQDSPIFWACLFLGLLLLFIAGMNSLNRGR